jgi:hypothetical protein
LSIIRGNTIESTIQVAAALLIIRDYNLAISTWDRISRNDLVYQYCRNERLYRPDWPSAAGEVHGCIREMP